MSDYFDEVDILASVCRSSFEEFCREFWQEVPGAGKCVWNWHMTLMCQVLQDIAERVFRNEPRLHDVVFNVAPGTSKSTLASILYPSWIWTRMPSARIISASHTDTLVLDLATKSRYVIQSEKYRECFPGIQFRPEQNAKSYYANTLGGDRFCCTVAGKSPMGMHGSFLLVDDPIDPKKAVSDAELEVAKQFFDAVIPSRKVDKEVSVMFLVMQRLAEGDPTGHLIEKSKREGAIPILHICLPAEIEEKPDGTMDTRNVIPSEVVGNYVDGLMDPVRLTRRVLKERRADGMYSYCTPGHSPILMADWSERPIEEVEVGEEVVGYTIGRHWSDEREEGTEGKHPGRTGAASIVKAKVVAKTKREAEVVKLTMASGREVFCTPDHEWWTRRKAEKKSNRKVYAPARVGGTLFSVYDPLPKLSHKKQRYMDWLGGMLDGEASCKFGSIAISQSPEHNPEVWEKILKCLSFLKFDFAPTVLSSREVYRRKKGTKEYYTSLEKERGFVVINGGRNAKMRILNQCILAKRQQIVDSIWNASCKVSNGGDKVVSIEPVGKMTVYGLTTTTGNYVVWGYASRNCGQYLQSPTGASGSMFREEFFLQVQQAAPYRALRVRGWDRAATQDGGCYTAGVLMARDDQDRYHVEHCIHGQWEPFERNDRIVACAIADRARYGPNYEPIIYIERERGSTGEESFRHLARRLAGFKVKEFAPSGAKEVRAEPWSDQLAAKNVFFVVDGRWDFDNYRREHTLFPKGRYKDQVDASAMCFSILCEMKRKIGFRSLTFGRKTKGVFKLIIVTREELPSTVITDHPAILISITNPEPISKLDIPESGITNLMGKTVIKFADADPAHYQERWNEVLPAYGRTIQEVIMNQNTGKQLWKFLTGRYPTNPECVLFMDDGNGDARATSLAYAVCDVMGLKRKDTVYRISDGESMNTHQGPAPNNHVYAMVKATRGMIL